MEQTLNSISWQIDMNGRIGFKIQVAAGLGYYSLSNWCYLMMWLLSSRPNDPENDILIKKHGAEELCFSGESLIHAIWTEDEKAQQYAAYWMRQIGMSQMIWRWLELQLPNGKPLIWIPKNEVYLTDQEWPKLQHAIQMMIVDRYTL